MGTLVLAIGLPAAQGCGDSSGLAAAPVDPCAYLAPFTLDTAVTGALASADCVLGDGSHVDWYRFSASAVEAVRVTMDASFDAFLLLYTRAGVVVALDDNGAGATGTDASFTAILPAGDFVVGANSRHGGEIGTYALTATSTPLVVSGCAVVWLVGPVTLHERIEGTDCATPPYADRFTLLVRAGRTVTVHLSSVEVSPHVALYDLDGTARAASEETSGQSAVSLSYLVPEFGVYLLEASTWSPYETGGYTLTVSDFVSAPPALGQPAWASPASIQAPGIARPAAAGFSANAIIMRDRPGRSARPPRGAP